jgi:transcriptional regulator of acetoin/glycerol metabolism
MQERLLEQWRAFTTGVQFDDSTLRPVTLQAWKRCRDIGVDPERLQYQFLTEAELVERRKKHAKLIEAARPYLDHLSMALFDRSHAIALADPEGWIIEFRENPPNAFGGQASGICLGASWDERSIGNNGIGTALANGEPVFVYGVEHYALVYRTAHCLGVPIRVGGEVVGCLDVSVTRAEDADPAHMTIAQACVASIEATLDAWKRTEQEESDIHRFAALGKLLATTVHDLKGPLTVIRGIAQLGEMTSASPDEQQYFGKIVEHADQLESTIQELQALPSAPELTRASPAALLSEVLEEFLAASAAQGVAIEVGEMTQSASSVIPPLLKRALSNIVGNALKAMPSGGSLHASATTENGFVVLRMADTGEGIPEDLHERLFDPFVHGREEGTGLGLYIARNAIVEQHGGKLTFETSPSGTTFFVSLPLREPSDP